MTNIGFCPRCGEPRVGNFRFCRSCRFDFDELPLESQLSSELLIQPPATDSAPPPPVAAPQVELTSSIGPVPPAANPDAVEASRSGRRVLLLLAGLAWIASGLLIAVVAYAQWSVGQLLQSIRIEVDQDLRGLAVWNAVAAISMVVIGARILIGRWGDRRGLLWVTLWAAVNAVWGVYQIAVDQVNPLYALAVGLTALAGILTFVARDATPAAVAPGERPRSNSIVPGLVILGVIGVVAASLVNTLVLHNGSRQVVTSPGASPVAEIREACAAELGDLYDALTELDGRLAVGLNLSDYGERVGDASVAYERVGWSEMSMECVTGPGAISRTR